MATADDVAAYILEQQGTMSAVKLHKLVYYAQAWHLVWEDEPLFADRIQAWANGPVVPKLYQHHRGQFKVTKWSPGDSSKLSWGQRDNIDSVLQFYGDKEPFWLTELTHRERPWREAREQARLGPGERGQVEITKASMAEYYASLV